MKTKIQYKIMYDLELNHSIGIENHFITRVPGGWIYREISTPNSNSVSVPFNNEFMGD